MEAKDLFLGLPAEAWTALFTAALTVSTVLLWRATKRLAAGAEAQADDNKAAIAAAQRSADAASKQVELSRTAMVAIERAFVFCERIESHWVAKKGQANNDEIIAWVFTPVWRNAGKTPTVRAVSNLNSWVGIGVDPLASDFDFPDYANGSRNFIGPNATMHASPFKVTIENLQKIRAGEGHAYVWGWFDYDDIFGDTLRHRAEFCMELKVTGNPTFKEGGFAYEMFGPFNGTDADCSRQPTPWSGGNL